MMRFDEVKWWKTQGDGRFNVTVKIQDAYSSDWELNPIDCHFDTLEEAEVFRDEVLEHDQEVMAEVMRAGEYTDDDRVWCQVFLTDDTMDYFDIEEYEKSYEVIQ